MSDIAIRCDGLSKLYRIGQERKRYKTLRESLMGSARAINTEVKRTGDQAPEAANTFWALKDVSFEVKRGEVVGIIGRNGAGKSTLLKILARITEPSAGTVDIYGRVGSLLEVGTGFHPELTGRENISLNGAILGMKRTEIERKFDEMVAFAEIEKFIDTPVKHYSSGMYLRLAFAVAAHLEPDILLVDEVLAVGDVAFQKKCLGKMEDVASQGRTVLFVSHNLAAIRALCTTGLLLAKGRMVHTGAIADSLKMYMGAVEGKDAELAAPQSYIKHLGFEQISVCGPHSSTIDHSQSFDIETYLQLEGHPNHISLFCILHDAAGVPVFHLREELSPLNATEWGRTRHQITITLPALWLSPGLYSLQLKAILSTTGATSRYVSDPKLIDIFGRSSGVQCTMNPVATWRVDGMNTVNHSQRLSRTAQDSPV